MDVAIVVDSLAVGGAERLALESVRALVERGHHAAVVDLGSAAQSRLAMQAAEAGAEVFRCSTSRSHSLLDGARIVRLARFLRGRRFDVAQTHLSNANIIGVLTARLAGVPVAATLHSTVEHTHRRPRTRRALETASLRLATEVVAVSASVAEANRRRRPARVLTNPVRIPRELTPAQRQETRAALTGDPRRVLVVSVGRLTRLKAWPDLITAFGEVVRRHPDAVLVIAGDGELRGELERDVRQLGLHEHVRLLGERSDVPTLLGAADLFALSSHHEGLPLAVLEAMAAGCPVVATAVGELPTIVAGYGAGSVVPPAAPDLLADAISELVGDEPRRRRCGAMGRCAVAEHHGLDGWGDRLVTMLDDVSRRGHRSSPAMSRRALSR